jgi:GNAT superfamily N-acetyltransferase
MQWRDMGWPAYGAPGQKQDADSQLEDVSDGEETEIVVTSLSEPAPIVEIRDLFRKLYGEPDECRTPSPYLAVYYRFRGMVRTRIKNGQPADLGIADFGYWRSLKLGYIESVKVRPNIRGKGIGIKLVNIVLNYLQDCGIQRCYSFAVNPEGYRLLKNSGFTPATPDDPERPWRAWFEKDDINQKGDPKSKQGH